MEENQLLKLFLASSNTRMALATHSLSGNWSGDFGFIRSERIPPWSKRCFVWQTVQPHDKSVLIIIEHHASTICDMITCEAHVSLPIRGGSRVMFPGELEGKRVSSGILQYMFLIHCKWLGDFLKTLVPTIRPEWQVPAMSETDTRDAHTLPHRVTFRSPCLKQATRCLRLRDCLSSLLLDSELNYFAKYSYFCLFVSGVLFMHIIGVVM